MILRNSTKMLLARHGFWLPFIAVVSAVFTLPAAAQAPPSSPAPTPAAAAAKAVDTRSPSARIKRWFDIDALTVAARYRFVETANSVVAANQAQYQAVGRFRFKFDAAGRYTIAAGVLTGNNFLGGWNNTGWGTGTAQHNINVRQLYFDAKPVKGLELQVGGLSFNYGDYTEVTGYDSDGYLVGERIQVRLPKKLYFDEISATNGYLGDLLHPSVFGRLKHLDRSNYHQFLVRKQVNKNLSFTADYTFESGVDTLRQAVKVNVPKARFVDLIQFENYERLDHGPGYGFALYGQKHLAKILTLVGGFVRNDKLLLNGDRYPLGNRVVLSGIVRFNSEFSLTTVLIQGVGPIRPALPRTRLDVILSYNILETLHRKKLF
jgi:hypothetical protein